MVRRFLDGLYLGAGYAAGAFLVIIFVLMLSLAVGRTLNINVASGDDFAAWSMAAMAFLGLAHTFKSGEMIRVGLLLERFKGRTKTAIELFCLSVTLAYLVYFTWHVWTFVRFSYITNDLSTGVVPVPMWIPQTGFLAGLALLAIAVLDEIFIVLKTGRLSFEKEPPATTEEFLKRIAEGGGV